MFLHFAAFQVLAGMHLDRRVGKVSTEVFKRGMRRVPSEALVSACRLAFDRDFGPIFGLVLAYLYRAIFCGFHCLYLKCEVPLPIKS